jgi:hypothetical protein
MPEMTDRDAMGALETLAATEIDDAFVALADCVASNLIDLAWLDLCPPLAPMRADPRFAPLRAQVAARADAIRDAMRSG